jgi:hypothetical protein
LAVTSVLILSFYKLHQLGPFIVFPFLLGAFLSGIFSTVVAVSTGKKEISPVRKAASEEADQ